LRFFSLYFQINAVEIKPLWWIYFIRFYSSISVGEYFYK
jgi:hypothetical protein